MGTGPKSPPQKETTVIRTTRKILKTGVLIGTTVLAAKKLQRTTKKIKDTWTEDDKSKDPKIRYRN